MQATHDGKAAAAGDSRLATPAPNRVARQDDETPAPRESFAGRDDPRLIDEITGEVLAADRAGVRRMREIIIDRMGRGDLSSLAAMRLLTACDDQLAGMREAGA